MEALESSTESLPLHPRPRRSSSSSELRGRSNTPTRTHQSSLGYSSPWRGNRKGFLAPTMFGNEAQAAEVTHKHLEALEEKLSKQFLKSLAQHESSTERLGVRVASVEMSQPKLERRIAELKASFGPLSDEVQAQARCQQALDGRLWQFKRELQDDFRQTISQFDRTVQEAESTTRVAAASGEDRQRRQDSKLQWLESMVQQNEAMCQHLLSFLGDRVDRLECLEQTSGVLTSDGPDHDGADSVLLQNLNQQVADIEKKLAPLSDHALDAQTRFNAFEVEHGVRLSALRSKLESVVERVDRSQWDSTLDTMRGTMEDQSCQLSAFETRLETLGQACGRFDRTLEDLMENGRALDEANAQPQVSHEANAQPQVSHNNEGDATLLADLAQRLQMAERELGDLRTADLGSRITCLIDQLQGVIPKVIEHEEQLRRIAASTVLATEDVLKAPQITEGNGTPQKCQAEPRDLVANFTGFGLAVKFEAPRQERNPRKPPVVLRKANDAKSEQGSRQQTR